MECNATFSKILQASELLGTNAIQFYMEKEAFDQIFESGTSSPSFSLWGHFNSLTEAAGHFYLSTGKLLSVFSSEWKLKGFQQAFPFKPSFSGPLQISSKEVRSRSQEQK